MIGGLKRGAWIACDIDGEWYAFPAKPQFDGDQWRMSRDPDDHRDVAELSPDLFELPQDVAAENSLYQIP